MESFVVAVMIDGVLVCTLRFCAGGGENDRGGGKLDGRERWDVGNVQVLYVGSGVKEMDTGLL